MNALANELMVSGQTLTKACPLVPETVPGNSSRFEHICVSCKVKPLCPGPSVPASFPRNDHTQMPPSEKAICKETWNCFVACSHGRGAAVLALSADNWCLFTLCSGKTLAMQ